MAFQTSAAVDAESNSMRMGRPSAMYTRLSIGNLHTRSFTHNRGCAKNECKLLFV